MYLGWAEENVGDNTTSVIRHSSNEEEVEQPIKDSFIPAFDDVTRHKLMMDYIDIRAGSQVMPSAFRRYHYHFMHMPSMDINHRESPCYDLHFQ